MIILLQFLLLIAGFTLLVKGADWFVDGAAGIAARLGVPQLVIGLTIVAMGTSAPEAAISISSSLRGNADIAVGNVIGSNILNILLILGITSMITPLAIQKSTIRYELPFVILITAIFSGIGLSDSRLGRMDGLLLWFLFLLYLLYLLIMTRKGNAMLEEAETDPNASIGKLLLFLIIGAACIVFGSDLTVDAASELARIFGMSERLIGLTIVAFGTSLPELVTCISAGLKHNADIAIGNIVGSNIFNILFVLGSSALITPIRYQRSFLPDSLICIGVSILLLLCVRNRDQKLKRTGGILMLLCYAAYSCFLI